MSDNKDYAAWTLEALLAEEKKMKKKEILAAGAIGFLAGIMIFSIAKSGFRILPVFIPLFLIGIVYRTIKQLKQDQKQIQAAIHHKKTMEAATDG
jgi:hypothetical protein